jgi:hypothetical protein
LQSLLPPQAAEVLLGTSLNSLHTYENWRLRPLFQGVSAFFLVS